MAGFDILQVNPQYHPPVAPEMPKFDPTAVQLISHGTDTAVRALLGGIELAQRNRLEQEKMAQDLALTTEGHMIQRENNVLDYNSASANTKLMGERYGVLNELDRVQTGIARLKLKEAKRGIGAGMDFAHSVGAMSEDFDKRWTELGGNNPVVQSSPLMSALAIDVVGREFPNAIGATGIPERLASLRAQNDAQQIVLNLDGKGDRTYKPSEVLGLLQNKDLHDKVHDELLAKSGYGQDVGKAPGAVGKFFSKIPVLGAFVPKGTERVPSETLNAIEQSVKQYHPELIKPRIATVMPRTEKTFNAAVGSGRLNPVPQAQDQSLAGIEPDVLPGAPTPAPLVAEKDQAATRAQALIQAEMAKPMPDQSKIDAARDWYKRSYGEDLPQ